MAFEVIAMRKQRRGSIGDSEGYPPWGEGAITNILFMFQGRFFVGGSGGGLGRFRFFRMGIWLNSAHKSGISVKSISARSSSLRYHTQK